jgi:hypothetical protein
MIMYIRLTDGVPEDYSIERLYSDNPQTSFSENLRDDVLAQWDVYPVTVLPIPNFDQQTHYLKASDFYQINGVWHMHYDVEALPLSAVEQSMRDKRNQLLMESDWVILRAYEAQTPVPIDWADYRQKLRDIPMQQGFPYSTIWPRKPT